MIKVLFFCPAHLVFKCTNEQIPSKDRNLLLVAFIISFSWRREERSSLWLRFSPCPTGESWWILTTTWNWGCGRSTRSRSSRRRARSSRFPTPRRLSGSSTTVEAPSQTCGAPSPPPTAPRSPTVRSWLQLISWFDEKKPAQLDLTSWIINWELGEPVRIGIRTLLWRGN